MDIKKIVKKYWKKIMSVFLKIYTGNFSLYIMNDLEKIIDRDFFSQFGQDIYVFNNIFGYKKDGVFVDVGANHPIHGSNTYLLELNGWTGLAVEPQKKLRDIWPQTRKTPCLNYVIGPENKEVSFIEASDEEHGLSGIEGFNKVKNNAKKITVIQKRLDSLLTENKIESIDYLSIDVEGYEMKVLESIDFSKTKIKLIGLENDLGFKHIPIIGKRLGSELGNNKARNFLKDRGYKYIARIMCDDFFIKE
jgi:FkbM family methyltransferase